MKRVTTTLLALGLAAVAGAAPAQSYGNFVNDQDGAYYQPSPDRYGNSSGAIYDYARVVRVDPVIDSRHGGYASTSGQRCYDSYTDAYGSRDGYYRDGYNSDGYNSDGYARDPYYPQRGSYGTQTGATVATVIGGIAGAVLGSKIGGGSGSTAAAAVGAMAGGMAGRRIYENTQRNRYATARTGTVRVCDPVPARDGYTSYPVGDGRVTGYDVTYEYAGRTFRTRTDYHPGDRIRVRVDVRPE